MEYCVKRADVLLMEMLQDIQEIVQIVKKNREKKRSGVSTDLIRE
jgi:hypothetical protein